MSEVPGADLLMNSSLMSPPPSSTSLPELESVSLDFSNLPDLGSSSAPPEKPRLVPSVEDVGLMAAWNWLRGLLGLRPA